MINEIELHKCAFRLEKFDRLPERLKNDYELRSLFPYFEDWPCRCPKRIFKFYTYRPGYRSMVNINVCRNYFAELVHRYADGSRDLFEILARAKYKIMNEALGYHFLPNEKNPVGFEKTNIYRFEEPQDKNRIFYHRSRWDNVFTPKIDVLLDNHCYATYLLEDVLESILNLGIENSKEYISTSNLLEALAGVAKDILYHINATRGIKARLKDKKFIRSLEKLDYIHQKYYKEDGLLNLSSDMTDFILSIIKRIRKADYERLKI